MGSEDVGMQGGGMGPFEGERGEALQAKLRRMMEEYEVSYALAFHLLTLGARVTVLEKRLGEGADQRGR